MMHRLIQQERAMIVGVVNDDGSAVYWYDVPPAEYGNLRALNNGRLMISHEYVQAGFYSTDKYNYQTDGDPAAYQGEPHGNFRGYGNTGGYINSGGYISRPGYMGGWGRRY